MSIEIGDRVKVIFEESIYKGKEGRVAVDNTDKYWTRDYRVHLDEHNQFNYGFDENQLELVQKFDNTMIRVIAYKNKKMTSVYELVEERECDPNPGQYSLWCTGNGNFHSELKNYDKRYKLVQDAREKGFNVIKIFNQNSPKRYH